MNRKKYKHRWNREVERMKKPHYRFYQELKCRYKGVGKHYQNGGIVPLSVFDRPIHTATCVFPDFHAGSVNIEDFKPYIEKELTKLLLGGLANVIIVGDPIERKE